MQNLALQYFKCKYCAYLWINSSSLVTWFAKVTEGLNAILLLRDYCELAVVEYQLVQFDYLVLWFDDLFSWSWWFIEMILISEDRVHLAEETKPADFCKYWLNLSTTFPSELNNCENVDIHIIKALKIILLKQLCYLLIFKMKTYSPTLMNVLFCHRYVYCLSAVCDKE